MSVPTSDAAIEVAIADEIEVAGYGTPDHAPLDHPTANSTTRGHTEDRQESSTFTQQQQPEHDGHQQGSQEPQGHQAEDGARDTTDGHGSGLENDEARGHATEETEKAGKIGYEEYAAMAVPWGNVELLSLRLFRFVVGSVEELSTTPATQNLVRDQFESMFFSQVNFIKAALPQLRSQHTGHVLILSSIGGHIGTPCMATHTAATWALEGFCDSLAYEIAPFNIKVTIVQPNKEIQCLTNKITLAPQLPWYDSDSNPAPSVRDMLSNFLNTNPETALEPSDTEIISRFPKLPASAVDKMVMETVHALTAIGGHENPPARHIVGFEGAVAVKEKLMTVTEELEDFVEASVAVDIFDSELKAEARVGRAPAPVPAPAPTPTPTSTPAPVPSSAPMAEGQDSFDFMLA
ncbi:Retinol dehydrogenase 8 [Cytospora mali]|uniref:Retinol dehydrogenase 8 n=1 Tax=Cytospora mali TaxID=578113 RepID=A0A194W4B3_CYTMA|nr:Retinol dehydrogenase 8 [Valsa mali]